MKLSSDDTESDLHGDLTSESRRRSTLVGTPTGVLRTGGYSPERHLTSETPTKIDKRLTTVLVSLQ